MSANKLVQTFLATAMAGTPAAVLAETAPAKPGKVPVAPIHAPGTLIVQGTYPDTVKGQPDTLQFEIDASHKALAYIVARRIGVIQKGHSDQDLKTCPYFNYNASRYSIEEETKPGRILLITAQVTHEQIEAVQASGCVVISKPPASDIKNLDKNLLR